MRIRIREAKDSDREAFWQATLDTAWKDVPEDERITMDMRKFGRHFRQVAGPYLEDSRNQLFIADDYSGKFLGYMLLGQTTPFYSPMPHGFVYDIWVAEHARRQGVGGQLLEFALKYFKDKGLAKVKLETASWNTMARSLYEKMGFKVERLVLGRRLR